MKQFIILSVALLIGIAGFSQKNKFGHVNTSAIFESMPERETAKTAVEQYARQLEEQLQVLNLELEEKYNTYMEESETMPPSVKQNKEKELADLQQRIQNFQVSAQNDLQLKEQTLLEPMYTKIQDAIKAVGADQGFLYIFDETTLLFHSSQSVDLTNDVTKKIAEMP